MIIFDGIIYSLQRSKGGITRYFDDLQAVIDNNIESKLVLCDPNFYSGNTRRRDIRRRRSFERLRSCVIEENMGVFHSSYYRNPSQNFKGQVVLTIHDFVHEKYIPGFRSSLFSFQKRLAISRADTIITISKNTCDDLHYFHPEVVHKDVQVIYNQVNEVFSQVKQSEGIFQNENAFLFVGARNGYKNFNLVVSAISDLKWAKLLIAGGGSLSAHEYRTLQKSIPGRFQFLDFTSDENLRDLYRSSLALIYPSEYEGFGLPIAECLLSGGQVICQNKSSMKEVSAGFNISFDGGLQSLKAAMHSALLLKKDQSDEYHSVIGHKFSKLYFRDQMLSLYEGH